MISYYNPDLIEILRLMKILDVDITLIYSQNLIEYGCKPSPKGEGIIFTLFPTPFIICGGLRSKRA